MGVQNTCSELSSMNVLLHERMDVIRIKEWENWSTIELSVHEFKELGNPGIVLVESADTVIFFGLFMIQIFAAIVLSVDRLEFARILPGCLFTGRTQRDTLRWLVCDSVLWIVVVIVLSDDRLEFAEFCIAGICWNTPGCLRTGRTQDRT